MEITRTFKLKTTGDITATYHEQVESPVIIGSLVVNKKAILNIFKVDSLPKSLTIGFDINE